MRVKACGGCVMMIESMRRYEAAKAERGEQVSDTDRCEMERAIMRYEQRIANEVAAMELSAEQVVYYSAAADEVKIGREGCQPSNMVCLRSADEDISAAEIADIVRAAREWNEL